MPNEAGARVCTGCGAALAPAAESAPPPSQGLGRLGPYRLVEKLGEGGMGVVYRAQDERLGREVAVKVLHPTLVRDENLRARFRREAQVHAKILHPNVVTLLTVYEEADTMALVMEYVRGRNLRAWMRAHQPGLDEILHLADGMLAGLAAAHAIGVVHRDFKPANVLITDEGVVKIMDFGLAKPARLEKDLTQAGAIVGSYRYMAPEQIRGEHVDARTDLYAFGIVLYEMCTGSVPFDARGRGSEFIIMEKQVREPPEPPSARNPAVPPPLEHLILSLLAKNPEDRPASAEAVRRALRQVRHLLAHREIASARAHLPPPDHEPSNWEIFVGLVKALARKLGLGKETRGRDS